VRDRTQTGSYALFEIEIDDALVETLAKPPEGWDLRPPSHASRAVGDRWLRDRRSVALRVPSVIVPQSWNVLINPAHKEFDLKKARYAGEFKAEPRLR